MNWEKLKGVVVFVVDDNPNNLNVIKDNLTQYGLKVIPLRSGEAALDLITRVLPDIILLDVNMPGGIDGFETCRRLKLSEKTVEIPVIFISAVSESVNKITGFHAGGVDYVTKPVDGEELLSRINVHITISRLQKELIEVNRSLEEKVAKRTEDLLSVNKLLRKEIILHEKSEAELRHARNSLGNVLDSMPSIVFCVDSEGLVTQWNHSGEKVSGVSREEAVGRHFAKILPRMESERELVNVCIRENNTQHSLRSEYTLDNQVFYEDIYVYPLVSGDRQGAVIRIDDVTHKVLMEEMMIQSEKMLSIGGLAAGMAHEINNPLAGIVQTAYVMASRLGQKLDNPANRRAAEELGISVLNIRRFMEMRGIYPMIDTIRESGLRVAELVDSMLGFAYKSGSKVTLNSVTDILDKSIELAVIDYNMKKKYDFKLIKIIKEYEKDIPPVYCERSGIQQVFLNILHNGAQAMQRGEKGDHHFILRASYEKDTEMVCIEIEDNGPGIAENMRNRVFEPFFTTKEPGEGTGLGLSVSYFIITEHHGGDLQVDSKPDSGARFIVRLPLGKKE